MASIRGIGARATLCAAAALAVPAARGAGDDVDAIRTDLAAFVDAAGGIREEWDGPSPTALARALLERKEKVVQPLLKDAWLRVHEKGSPAADFRVPLERAIRFLYGFDGPADPGPKTGKDRIGFGGTVGAVYEKDGVVLARPGGTGERPKVLGEPGWDRDEKDRPATRYEDLVKGGRWRKPPRTEAGKLLKILDGGLPDAWSDEEKRAFALALGEACGADASLLPKILQRFSDDPNDEFLGMAVGATGAPRAAEELRPMVRSLAERVAGGREAALPLLRRVCRGLRRIDPAALDAEVSGLAGEVRDAALLGIGFRGAASVLCAEAEKATDPAGRTEAVERMLDLVARAGFQREFPSPADFPRVVRVLRQVADDGSDAAKERVENGIYLLLYMGWRDGDARIEESQNGEAIHATGRRLGPYPDALASIRTLDDALRAGRMAFSEGRPALFGAATHEAPEGDSGSDRAYSGIPCPLPHRAEAASTSPWKLSSGRTEGGLRLTLKYDGPKPVALDPLAFGFVCAEFLPVRITGAPGGPREFSYLKLEFGPLGGWDRWVVPAKELRVLAKGESFTWDVALRPEHRDAQHISLELNDPFRVDGAAGAPLLRRLGWSWIR